MSAHVVILGCGRSGTSIFGELFEHLPGYDYKFEPAFDTLKRTDFSAGPVAVKVPKSSPGEAMTPGLPFVLEELLAVVPEPRVIFWQVRHPLDAICSLRPGIEAGWSHNPRPPDFEQWTRKSLVMQCARHWQYINETGYEAVRDLAKVARYEELVSNPRAFALRICVEIGVDVTGCLTELERWVASVGNKKSPDSYEAKHQAHWSRQDHSRRVERWRENLSQTEIDPVRPIIQTAADILGYRLPT